MGKLLKCGQVNLAKRPDISREFQRNSRNLPSYRIESYFCIDVFIILKTGLMRKPFRRTNIIRNE